MLRHTRKLYNLAKLWRNSFTGLASLLHRMVSRSTPIENKDTPHWFIVPSKSSVVKGAWYWVRGNLTWVASLAVVLLGLFSMNAVMAHRSSVRPPTSARHRTQRTANKTEAKKPDYASSRADASDQKEQASSNADRQRVARRLQLNLQAQGLDDVVVVTGGEGNNTLVLSSKIFRDSARREAEMKIARTYWKIGLCKSGFKAVVLDGRSLFGSSWHEYPLQCPKTPVDRVSMATGLRADFEMAGKPIQVHATGPNKDVLSLMASTHGLDSAASRDTLFQELKNQGNVRNLCAWGFKQVSIQSNSPESTPSVFSMDCASP